MSSTAGSQFPSVDPAWTLFTYVVVPWFPIFFGVYKAKQETKWRGSKTYRFFCNLAFVLYRYAPIFAIGQFAWSCILMVNQASYSYSNLQISYDMGYYSQVDSYDFNALSAVNNLAALNSINALNIDYGEDELKRRRLQISALDSTFTVSYHTEKWQNIITEDHLRNICFTERRLLNATNLCYNTTAYYESIIPTIFTKSCTYKMPFQEARTLFGRTDNSPFVTDYINPYEPSSPVLLSYFSQGTCSQRDPYNLHTDMNELAVNGTLVTITSSDVNENYLKDIGGNTAYYLLASFAINTLSLLPLLQYKYVSLTNSAGVVILYMYASNAVMTFGSSWRGQVKRGLDPTIPNIMTAYMTFGQRFLYTTLLAVICLFTLSQSSVVAVKQFAHFTGLSVLSFYVFMHYVIIPWWIFTSWFTIPKRYHRKFHAWRVKICFCCKVLNDIGMVDTLTAAMLLGGEGAEEESDNEEGEGGSRAGRRNRGRGSDEDSEEGGQTVGENSLVPSEQIVFVGEDPNKQPGEASEVIVSARVMGEEDTLGAAEPPQFEEAQYDTQFCRGKRPLKLVGFLVLLLVVIALAIVYSLSVSRFQLDAGLPDYFPTSSNLQQELIILEKYKNDLFVDKTPNSQFSAITFAAPSVAPTAAPIGITNPPTRRPTLAPTVGPPPEDSGVSMYVLGCWGVEMGSGKVDQPPDGAFTFSTFTPYVQTGIQDDMENLCTFAGQRKSELSLQSDWEEVDCIYTQYQRAFLALPANLRTPVNAFTVYSTRFLKNGFFTGYASNGTFTSPVWVCSNFTVKANVSSIGGDPATIDLLRQNWKSAFASTSVKAKEAGVTLMVTSPAFTYPLLSHDEQSFLRSCLVVTIVAYIGLLYIFTLSDFGLTVFGALTIFTILSICICIHVYLVSSQLDLWDVVLLQAVMLILVDFPLYLIEEYMAARAQVDREMSPVAVDKALSPALAKTNKRFRGAVLPPLMVLMLGCIPVLSAKLRFLQRVGSYIIIIGGVSGVMCVFFQPYLLAFGCRTKICETLCYVEEEGEVGPDGGVYGNLPAPAAASLPPPRVEEEQDANRGEDEYEEEGAAAGYYDDGGDSYTQVSGSTMGYPPHQPPMPPPPRGSFYASPPVPQQMMRMPTQVEMMPMPPQPRPHHPSMYNMPPPPPPQDYGPPPPHMNRHPSMIPPPHPQPPNLHASQSMYGYPPHPHPSMYNMPPPQFSPPQQHPHPHSPPPQGGLPLQRGPSVWNGSGPPNPYAHPPPPQGGGGMRRTSAPHMQGSYYDAPGGY
eukprot:gene24133-29189_t